MSLRTIRKRRVEGKTDYKARMSLLKSKLPRIVIRRTNRYLLLQLIESSEGQDKILVTTTSKELIEYGLDKKFSGSLKSLPANYLTGLLMAKKIGKGKFIVDSGMVKNQHGGRIYASIKGLIDGGLQINADEKVFPSEDRLKGGHLKEEVKTNLNKLKENIEKNGKRKN